MIIEAEKQENARVKAGEKELTDVTILQWKSERNYTERTEILEAWDVDWEVEGNSQEV